MGSGKVFKSIGNVLTFGALGAKDTSKANTQALQMQMLMQQQALNQQLAAQREAMNLQKTMYDQTRADNKQAAEQSAKSDALVPSHDNPRANSADLTKGVVRAPNRQQYTLGNAQGLGADAVDSDTMEDWYKL